VKVTLAAALGLALLLPAGLTHAQDPPPAQEPAQALPQGPVIVEETLIDRQVREIASVLRCPVCQGLSLQDSPSELAQEMRDVIRTQLEEGKTPDDVKAYFVASYGEWILLEPKAQGFNLAVYLLPVGAVLFGGVLLFIVARRWLRREGTPVDASVAEEPDPDLAPWEDVAAR
jgi:cytochrome c-type biogenesis protein CcmH